MRPSPWAIMGLAWVPDLGRNIPATEAPGDLDTSVVQTGKLMSEWWEGAFRPHISAGYIHSAGRAQSPTQGSVQAAQRMLPVQPSLHYDVQLIILNKNILAMRCGSDLRPLGKPCRARCLWCGPPASGVSLGQTLVPFAVLESVRLSGYPWKGQLCRQVSTNGLECSSDG